MATLKYIRPIDKIVSAVFVLCVVNNPKLFIFFLKTEIYYIYMHSDGTL